MTVQGALDEATLNTAPPPVNQADFPEAGRMRGPHVLLDHILHLTRREGMQVERILDRYFVHCRVAVRGPQVALRTPDQSASYSATTDVVMPPRAEKSPVTVIRFGLQAATRSSRIWLVTAS